MGLQQLKMETLATGSFSGDLSMARHSMSNSMSHSKSQSVMSESSMDSQSKKPEISGLRSASLADMKNNLKSKNAVNVNSRRKPNILFKLKILVGFAQVMIPISQSQDIPW